LVKVTQWFFPAFKIVTNGLSWIVSGFNIKSRPIEDGSNLDG
jgi:hypothetical protein